ncbi:Cacna1h, partial [Symbiodinium sp. KB8]
MAERLSLDDLDEVLIEKLKGRKDEELQTSTTGSADSDSALGRALQDKLNVVVHKLDLQMELLQRLAFDDLPVPDIPEPPEMEQYSFSRNVSPTDAECEFPVAARDTNKTVASQLLSTYTEDDRQRRDTAHMVNSSQTRRRFSRVSKSPKAGGDSRSCCFWTWIQHLVAHPGFEMFWAFVVLSNAVVLGIDVEELFAIQIAYTVLFALELTLRILGRGFSVFCAEGCGWIWLDTLIVVISIWESAVEIAGESSGSLASVTSLKSFRLVRLTRLLRTVQFIRIFRFIMALRTLVTSIFSTLKALSWALILLFLIMYVFAILFTQSVNDYVRDPDVAPLSDELLMACDKYYGSMQDTV